MTGVGRDVWYRVGAVVGAEVGPVGRIEGLRVGFVGYEVR
jgi:hypothetical protein